MKEILVLGHSQNPAREITPFEEVMWGTSPNQPGRLPVAIFEMIKSSQGIIVLSGGTEFQGKKEAREMKNCLFKNLSRINEFKDFFGIKDFNIEEIRSKLKEDLVLEEDSQTTFQNFQYSWDLLKEKRLKIEEVVVVTSYDHLIKAIISAFEWREKGDFRVRMSFVPSYTPRFSSGTKGLTLVDQKGKGRIISIILKLLSSPSPIFASDLKKIDEQLPEG